MKGFFRKLIRDIQIGDVIRYPQIKIHPAHQHNYNLYKQMKENKIDQPIDYDRSTDKLIITSYCCFNEQGKHHVMFKQLNEMEKKNMRLTPILTKLYEKHYWHDRFANQLYRVKSKINFSIDDFPDKTFVRLRSVPIDLVGTDLNIKRTVDQITQSQYPKNVFDKLNKSLNKMGEWDVDDYSNHMNRVLSNELNIFVKDTEKDFNRPCGKTHKTSFRYDMSMDNHLDCMKDDIDYLITVLFPTDEIKNMRKDNQYSNISPYCQANLC